MEYLKTKYCNLLDCILCDMYKTFMWKYNLVYAQFTLHGIGIVSLILHTRYMMNTTTP
jgi:hypothetical protein